MEDEVAGKVPQVSVDEEGVRPDHPPNEDDPERSLDSLES